MSYHADNPGGGTAVGDVPSPQAIPASSKEESNPRRWGRTDQLGWALVALLIVVQWAMFRQFCLREVVWSYPPNHDQLNYLTESYGGYELTLDTGLRKGLAASAGFAKPPRRAKKVHGEVVLPGSPAHASEPQYGRIAVGFLLPLQATLMFFITGPDRLTALTLNLFYFALFQCMLVATLRAITGRWSVALIGLGLLLTALTPFMWAGGIVDFRFDFGSFCLFGAFLCAIFRSGMFLDRRWSIVAGLFGAALFLLRFLTIVYMGGILGLLVLFLILRLWRSDGAIRAQRIAQLRNALIACGLILVVAIPTIIQRFSDISGYYIVGHVTGKEPKMRALEQGVTDLKSNLLFYPKSLVLNHVGLDMLKCAAALVLLGLLVRLGRPWRRGRAGGYDLAAGAVLVAAALLVPLGALTLDSSKSPVVADIMVGPLAWGVLLAFIALAGLWSGEPVRPAVRFGLPVLAAAVLCFGLSAQCSAYGSRTSMSRQRDQITRLLDLYDQIGTDAHDMGWRSPRFAFNTTSDAVNYRAFAVREFEARGLWFDSQEVLAGTIFHRTEKDSLERMRSADFAVLTEIPPPEAGVYELPFDRDMRRVTPELMDWCRQNMIELQSGPILGREVSVFVRPAVRVQGEPDGWIARHGATVMSLAQILRQKPTIELWGPSSRQQLPTPPHVQAELSTADRPPVQVPAELSYERSDYRLTLKLDPAKLPETGKVTIELSFDSAFIPRKVSGPIGAAQGGAADDRELVFKLPDRATLH